MRYFNEGRTCGFSNDHKYVGLFAQAFSLYCATKYQTFDHKYTSGTSEQDFFLKAEVHFVLKMQTFLCVIFRYVVKDCQ